MSNSRNLFEMTDADFEEVRRETLKRDAVEPRARTAHYNRETGQLVIEMKNGLTLLVPVELVQGLAGADPNLIAKVGVDGRGWGLIWEELDVAISVPGLLNSKFGKAPWMNDLRSKGIIPSLPPTASEMGRKGGSASTPKKQSASRANGKLGGRPPKKMVV